MPKKSELPEIIDDSWTLFIDRDGVINKRIIKGYVKSIEEFEILPNVFKAFNIFDKIFGKIIVVTNQQGVGKGIMTVEQLHNIHNFLINEIKSHKGRIDSIYFCTDLHDSGSFFRKPEIGMALKAKKNHKEINFKKSIMVGDSVSDLIFGKKLKMKTILISEDFDFVRKYSKLIDLTFPSLFDFAIYLEKKYINVD